jgi:hypothetical protein
MAKKARKAKKAKKSKAKKVGHRAAKGRKMPPGPRPR